MTEGPAILTNISCGIEPDGGRDRTLVSLQSTRLLRYRLQTGDPLRAEVFLPDAVTRMPEETIRVNDGLLRTVTLSRRDKGLHLALSLAGPTAITARARPGIPSLLLLAMDRRPLRRIAAGRCILIDPGHGGQDPGGRGPDDLLEKDRVLAAAGFLQKFLAACGFLPVLTRRTDIALAWRERLAELGGRRPAALISLHTAWYPEAATRGFAVAWLTRLGQALALRLHRAFLDCLPLPDRGVYPGPLLEAFLDAPAVLIELATISNPLEEAWLRSPAFLERVAGAIANGLLDYLGARGSLSSR